MITISLCMIVKDEESCLANCLSSVKDIVDEFIIVDTGSTDRTKEIIKEFTDKEYSFTWINDFSAARNYCFSLATMDYILWLDADDIISPEYIKPMKELKATLPNDMDVVRMIYDITFNEQGQCILSVARDKLLKNKTGFYWRYFIHEELVTWGNSMTSSIHITHTSDHGHYSRYLKNYKQRIADGYTLLPHEQFFYAAELFMAKKYKSCIPALVAYIKNPSDNTYEQARALDYLCFSSLYLKKEDRGVKLLLEALRTLPPTAFSCYFLGQYFQARNKWTHAVFWYTSLTCNCLLETPPDLLTKSYLQLCICYYALGNVPLAIYYNNQAFTRDPDNEYVKANKAFFDSLKP